LKCAPSTPHLQILLTPPPRSHHNWDRRLRHRRPSISSNDTGERGNVRTTLYVVSFEPKTFQSK
jgi:hypothetical protein